MMFFELVIPPKRFSCPQKKTPKTPSNLSKSLQHCLEVWSRTARNYEEFPPSEELWSAHLESGKPRRQAMFFAHLGMGMDTCRYQKKTLLQHFFWGQKIQRSYIYLSIYIYIYIYIPITIYLYNYIYISIWVFSTRDSMGTLPAPFSGRQAMRQRRHHRQDGKIMAM